MAAVTGITSNTQNTVETNAASTSPSGASEQTFLELLVAQLKNQDPLNPTDGTQFVAELAQFSELEQVIGIHGDLDAMVQASQAAQTTTPTTNN
jgi:flagellar basal-body rod modification protein FlgD